MKLCASVFYLMLSCLSAAENNFEKIFSKIRNSEDYALHISFGCTTIVNTSYCVQLVELSKNSEHRLLESILDKSDVVAAYCVRAVHDRKNIVIPDKVLAKLIDRVLYFKKHTPQEALFIELRRYLNRK
jgi:hypothetical protein